jgi:threonine/homoserine/homoserine lactone efflux protein
MAGLWAVPGPVWVALTARALSGGFAAAWPLAVGVALGDLIWPLAAILGLSWILSPMAISCRPALGGGGGLPGHGHPADPQARRGAWADSRLTRPGMWAGFSVGVAAVIGNPKAILFYMGALPGFFDAGTLTLADIGAIIA